ncbi:methyltransferase [Thermomonas flagellata]|uniref:methyltransferase n=1 Tax=Thermomonas flagellata TaxID=2888524 RepID=UPI001F03F065|nr:methyltransferase [Thermomonas flagellata]
MTVGSFIRGLAGPLERPLCDAYRALFMNVGRCAQQLQAAISSDCHLIDVGGGDGAVLDAILRVRPDLTATMLDLKTEVGKFLAPEIAPRVEIRAGTSIQDYLAQGGAPAACVLVSDVVHHVPADARTTFLHDCVRLLQPGGTLIIKDVAPGHLVSLASMYADRYITGDRHVRLIAPDDLVGLLRGLGLHASAPLLAPTERPNYAFAFRAVGNLQPHP